MYDELSLGAALTDDGFRDAVMIDHATSNEIDGWSSFGLDVNSDGSPAHPNSLSMEAVKPGAAGTA